MSEQLSPEELALLAQAETVEDQAEDPADDKAEEPVARKPRKRAEEREHPVALARGPHTPVQFEDDGWGGLPVQMRG